MKVVRRAAVSQLYETHITILACGQHGSHKAHAVPAVRLTIITTTVAQLSVNVRKVQAD